MKGSVRVYSGPVSLSFLRSYSTIFRIGYRKWTECYLQYIELIFFHSMSWYSRLHMRENEIAVFISNELQHQVTISSCNMSIYIILECLG